MIKHDERQGFSCNFPVGPEFPCSPRLDQVVAAALGAGVRVKHIARDRKVVDVEMKLRFWNANYVARRFGGSLLAMTGAFYMLILLANPGAGPNPLGQGGGHSRPNASDGDGGRSFACPITRGKTSAGNRRPCRNTSRFFAGSEE